MSHSEEMGKESIDYKSLGKRVRELRRDNSMTQQELADSIGKSITFINKIESDNTSISLKSLIDLTKVLNTSMDFLLFESLPRDKTIIDMQIELMLENFTEADKKFVLDMMKAMKNYKSRM